jgi:DNA repair exonuclease SbcCD ATPase subunit
MIRFPVLKHIKIAGYQLFPGNGHGIDRELPHGVTVIVGINGLGKTTLLNALFRALSGPAEWAERRVDQPARSTPTTLTAWNNLRYFASRTRDEAKSATITAILAFGDDTIEIERSLQDLRITRLVHNGERVDDSTTPEKERGEKNEGAYRAKILALSGLESFEDFFLVLRYLTFFLEERPPVVWDATAQSDLLRFLFFAPGEVTEHRKLYDQIQQADSRRRNIRPIYNRLNRELEVGRARSSVQEEVTVTVRALQSRSNALEERSEELRSILEAADEARHDARRRVETIKLEVEALRSEYAAFEREHLVHLFPTAPKVAQFVFLRRDSGCLVCGNDAADASAYIDASAEEHRCPACRRFIEPEPAVIPSGELNARRMAELDNRISETLRALQNREDVLRSSVNVYENAISDLRANSADQEEVRNELAKLSALLPPSAEHLEELSKEVHALHREMEKWRSEQQVYEAAFEESLARGRSRIEEVSKAIAARFSEIAGAFLSEQCDLQYQTEKRRIGEEGVRFEFPRFIVRMTSATSPTEFTPRGKPTDVSESQREFLDLAFRMALMDVAARGEPRMLVIETPEASLDVLFVDRAGEILGEFANGGSGIGNRLIVSSNLTGGHMIPALLGATWRPGQAPAPHEIPIDQRENHVLNLLELAAPNAAKKQNDEQYQAMYLQAIKPEEYIDRV